MQRKRKEFECYRISNLTGESVIMSVMAFTADGARDYFKKKLKSMYGDERPFFVRGKK